MLWTDIREVKAVLEIDPANTAEDKKILFFLEQVSSWFEEWTNRPGLAYSQKTKWYSGTGNQKLQLKHRPVFPFPNDPNNIITVVVDQSGYFGSASGSFATNAVPLVYGRDYCLDIDQDDGSSRSGILFRIGDYWNKPQVRQVGYLSSFIGPDMGSIKVTYWAGYTVDTLPAHLRMAANVAVSAYRYCFPLGLGLSAESYEERSISMAAGSKDYLYSLSKAHLFSSRNWRF